MANPGARGGPRKHSDLAAALRADVAAGLTSTPKELPSKWFYDEEGSALFDTITRLPEYYPTRRERAILVARAGEMAELTGAELLIELGSGTSEKTRLLLDALRRAGTLRLLRALRRGRDHAASPPPAPSPPSTPA